MARCNRIVFSVILTACIGITVLPGAMRLGAQESRERREAKEVQELRERENVQNENREREQARRRSNQEQMQRNAQKLEHMHVAHEHLQEAVNRDYPEANVS